MLDLNLNLNLGLASGGGDPTALNQNNADTLFTALGLTQAGTGTTWGETGQDATPLYPVAAGKVPLAVEEINGKNYFGPIVNPAGTNLALYSSDATAAAWTKTGCTATLAVGGLEHDAEWRGEELADISTAEITDASLTNVSLYENVAKSAFYFVEYTLSGVTPDRRVRLQVLSPSYLGGFHSTDGLKQAIVYADAGTNIRFNESFLNSDTGTVYVTGISVREVDAHTLLTATTDNATCLQSITSTSGERVSKFWVQTEDEDVFVSHGAPTGSALYEDAFDSDTSGEWNRGTESVDGTLTVSGGQLISTKGASDGANPRWVRPINGLTIGKLYRVNCTPSGTAATRFLSLTASSSGIATIGDYISVASTATGFVMRATATTHYLVIQQNGAAVGATAIFSDASVYEVAETELTPGSAPVPVDLSAYTAANSGLGIRLANNGDSVRLYGVQHQVAARPLRPYIGPTAGSTVTSGARSLMRTGMSGITEVDVEIASLIPPSTGSFLRTLWIGKASDNVNKRIDVNYNAGTLYVNVSGAQAFSQAISADTPFKMRIQQSTTGGYSVTLNDGTPVTGANNLPTDFDALAIGTFQNGAVHGEQPILAFRDNIGNLLDGNRGWNHSLLDNWT